MLLPTVAPAEAGRFAEQSGGTYRQLSPVTWCMTKQDRFEMTISVGLTAVKATDQVGSNRSSRIGLDDTATGAGEGNRPEPGGEGRTGGGGLTAR